MLTFFAMGGYGGYVWSAYGIVLGTLTVAWGLTRYANAQLKKSLSYESDT